VGRDLVRFQPTTTHPHVHLKGDPMPMSQEERLREQSAAEGVPDQAQMDERAEQRPKRLWRKPKPRRGARP
jgi:hypothetical protein